jgi:plastocyanin
MHAALAHFAPILAAEKSKVPFYIAGGVLVVWALALSLGVGLRNPSFPGTVAAERAVMAITVVLVLLAISMAVVTSGGSLQKAIAQPAVTQAGHEGTSGAGGSSLKQEADPEGQLRFATKDLSAKAGTVTIGFANPSPLPHNLTIAQGTTVLGATPTFQGGAKTLTLKLAAGTYVFYCSVPGHRQAGMEGKLDVR